MKIKFNNHILLFLESGSQVNYNKGQTISVHAVEPNGKGRSNIVFANNEVARDVKTNRYEIIKEPKMNNPYERKKTVLVMSQEEVVEALIDFYDSVISSSVRDILEEGNTFMIPEIVLEKGIRHLSAEELAEVADPWADVTVDASEGEIINILMYCTKEAEVETYNRTIIPLCSGHPDDLKDES